MYIASYKFTHTTGDAADSTVFTMRNPSASGVEIKIRRIVLQISCDAVTATEAQVGYYFCRFSGGNDPTGGSAAIRVNTNSKASASKILAANIRYGGILTTADVGDPPLTIAFETGKLAIFTAANTPSALQAWDLRFSGGNSLIRPSEIILHPGEGLAMRTAIAAVNRLSHTASIWWHEVQR